MANRTTFNVLRASVHLTDQQRAIVIGALLGDGALIETVSKNNFRLQIEQCAAQQAYVFWKFEALKPFILTPPAFQPRTRSWRFRTISHPELTELGHLFYRDHVKVVPDTIGKLLMEPISLAVWYMDDGSRYEKRGLVLNTQCFQHREVDLLKQCLIQNFDLAPISIHKDHRGWRLYINRSAAERMQSIVRPFILPELMYKMEKPCRDYTSAPASSGVKI